jgi:hypothetical protein
MDVIDGNDLYEARFKKWNQPTKSYIVCSFFHRCRSVDEAKMEAKRRFGFQIDVISVTAHFELPIGVEEWKG